MALVSSSRVVVRRSRRMGRAAHKKEAWAVQIHHNRSGILERPRPPIARGPDRPRHTPRAGLPPRRPSCLMASVWGFTLERRRRARGERSSRIIADLGSGEFFARSSSCLRVLRLHSAQSRQGARAVRFHAPCMHPNRCTTLLRIDQTMPWCFRIRLTKRSRPTSSRTASSFFA